MQSVNYILYEILRNIYKHSKFKNAYIQINYYRTIQNFDICIIYDSIGIPGSFSESAINYEQDDECIYNAINGKTTDKEKFNLHGRGLNSSVRITTLGFKGEMLIASGKEICIINEHGAETYLNKNKMQGTFIVMRINNKKIDNL